MQTKVTVLIPTYNRADFICPTINSVINQTYCDWKILLVDDGSTDNTLEVIEKNFPKETPITIIRNSTNLGISRALNIGLDHTDTPYLVQLDSDDLLLPFTLEILKKPCIASNIDGIPEIIIDGETGILINPVVPVIPDRHLPLSVLNGQTKNLQKPLSIAPEDLGESILKLLNNPELCVSMGEKAYQRVVKLFNYKTYRNKLIRIYRDALKNE